MKNEVEVAGDYSRDRENSMTNNDPASYSD